MKKRNQVRLSLLAGLLALGMLVNMPAGQSLHFPGPPPVPAKPALAVGDSLDAQTGLILAPGFQLVKSNCLRCHSPQLITAKRASREGWEATIRWMQQTQGLWDLGKNETVILDYLAKHYAPANEGRRPPLKNVQWYRLEN